MADAPRVSLVALSPPEVADFVERQIVEYADQKRRAGHWRAQEALARSPEAMEDFLPGRPPPPGHRFFKGGGGAAPPQRTCASRTRGGSSRSPSRRRSAARGTAARCSRQQKTRRPRTVR